MQQKSMIDLLNSFVFDPTFYSQTQTNFYWNQAVNRPKHEFVKAKYLNSFLVRLSYLYYFMTFVFENFYRVLFPVIVFSIDLLTRTSSDKPINPENNAHFT